MAGIRKKINNNSGFTLIELVVTVAILIIVVGMGIVGFNLIYSGNSKKAVKTIYSQISELRTNTLSIAGSWRAELYLDDGEYKFDIIKTEYSKDPSSGATVTNQILMSTTNFGKRLTIEYKDSVNGAVVIDGSKRLIVSFKQGSGKVDSIQLKDGSLSSLIGSGSASGDINVKTRNNSRQSKLTLWYETGKIISD